MKKGVIIAIIVAVVLGAGLAVFALTNKSNNNTASDTSSNTSNTTPSTPASNNSTPADNSSSSTGAVITYTDSGFSPATLTVKAGTKVTIKNGSSQPMQFDSDPHPVHTDDPELNVGIIQPGESMSFTPTTTGTHGYHNHLDSSQTGTLIVQ